MGIDQRLLGLARRAGERIEESERVVGEARREFQRAIRTLYLDGASMREIAEAVGLSHQRVHQLLDLPRAGRASRAAKAACSFCGREQSQVKKLICGPGGVGVCEKCVALAEQALDRSGPASSLAAVVVPTSDAPCSFCGKTSESPRLEEGRLSLVASAENRGVICKECLDLAREILREEAVAD
jgi:hypothetical protein